VLLLPSISAPSFKQPHPKKLLESGLQGNHIIDFRNTPKEVSALD
jgi:hypothetical protein